MAVVADVLPERLAVVAGDDPEQVPGEAARVESAHQELQRLIGVAQRVQVATPVIDTLVRTRFRRLVGMMSGDRQIREEETRTGRERVDPAQHRGHRGRFVDAEAGLAMPADITGIGEGLVAAAAHDGFHAEIAEPAGMEQRCPIAALRQPFGERRAAPAAIR